MPKSIEERRAALIEKHQDELAALEAEIAVNALLPLAPTYVHFASKAEPWITYKVKAVSDALPILAAFPVVAGSAVDDGCVYVGPQARERGKIRFEAAELIEVRLEHGKQYRSQRLSWWTPLGDKIARVCVDIEQWPWKRQPSCSVRYNGHGEVTRAEHELPNLGEWKRIKWAAGSPDACAFSLYFDSKAKAQTWLEGGAA